MISDFRRLVPPLLVLMMLASCGGHKSPAAPNPGPGSGVVSDFALTDVNPNSATFNMAVSPRNQVGLISAWYFGHAT